MKTLLLIAASLATLGCATDQKRHEARTADACEKYGEREPGEEVLVMHDRSTETNVAAVGVTASGGLKPAAGIAGPAVGTSRGGALLYKGESGSVHMSPCP